MNEIANTEGAGKEEAGTGRANATHGQERRRRAGQILNTEQCLSGLSQLPGLLAMGMVKPGQANAMRGAFRDILQHHQNAGRTNAADGLADEDVLTILRNNPEMFNMLEPLLTDEQIEMVMRNAPDGDEYS